MKKFYTQPEVEVTKLTAEDILEASDEVLIDGDDLFGGNS